MSPKQNDFVKYISLYSPQVMNSYGSEIIALVAKQVTGK